MTAYVTVWHGGLWKELYQPVARPLIPDPYSGRKVCRVCRVRQSKKNFHRHTSTRDGLQTWCKTCAGKYFKAWKARQR